jgi:hypothetical protein
MPYCENCGAQLNPNVKFCSNCGAKQNVSNAPVQNPNPPRVAQPVTFAPPPPPPPPPPAPVARIPPPSAPVYIQNAGSENVIGALILRKPKSLGRYDTWTGVLTNQRFIFAQMTGDMVKDAAMQARDQAKADGKGFFGQRSDQLKATFGYTKKYLSMQPSAIIAETPGNFAVNNDTIREIKLKLRIYGEEYQGHNEFEVEIKSNAGKYEYRIDENSDFVNLLKKAYPDRVKMPFGYFNKSINIKL